MVFSDSDSSDCQLSGIPRIVSVNIIQPKETPDSGQIDHDKDSNIFDWKYKCWYSTNELGNHYLKYKQYEKATQYHQNNLDYARNIIKNRSREAESIQNLGMCFKLRSLYDGAILLFERLLLIGGQLDNSSIKNIALYHLIDTYQKKARDLKAIDPIEFKTNIKNAFEKAKEYYIERMNLMDTHDSMEAVGQWQEGIQQLYSRLGHLQIDLSTYLDILKESRKLGSFAVEFQSNISLIGYCLISDSGSDSDNDINIYFRNLIDLCNNFSGNTISMKNFSQNYHHLLILSNVMGSFYLNLFLTEKIDDKIGQSIAYECLTDLYKLIGYHRYALKYAELQYNICHEIDDSNGRDRANANVAEIRCRIENENEKNSNQSKTNKRIKKSMEIIMWEVNNKSGIELYDSKQYNRAAYYHRENIKLAKGKFKDPYYEMESMQKLALCYRAMKRIDLAFPIFKTILERSKEMKNEFIESVTLLRLIEICNKMGNNQDLEKYREEKLSLLSRYCDKTETYEKFEEIYTKLIKFNSAESLFTKSLRRAEEVQCDVLQLQGFMNLGDCLFAAGKTEEAIQNYNKILKLSYDLSSGSVTSPIFYNYYHINCGLRKLISLLGSLHLNLLITKRINDRPGQCVVYKFLCEIYQKLGNNQRAFDYAKEYEKLSKELKYFYGLIKSKYMLIELAGSIKNTKTTENTGIEVKLKVDGHNSDKVVVAQSSSTCISKWKRQNSLACEYFDSKKYDQAEELFMKNLILARDQLNDKFAEAKTLNNLGVLLRISGKLNESIGILEELLKLAEKLRNPIILESTVYELGCTYLSRANQKPQMNLFSIRDDLNKAANYFESSLAVVGYQNHPEFALNLLGDIYCKLEDYSTALHYYLREFDIVNEECNEPMLLQTNCNIANCYKSLKNYSESFNYFKQALDLAVKMKDRQAELCFCFELQNSLQLFERFNRLAIDFNKRCIRLASDLKDTTSEGIAYWCLSYIHYRRNELKIAYDYAKLHLRMAETANNQEMITVANANIQSLSNALEKLEKKSTTV